jgi:hypothetical protein
MTGRRLPELLQLSEGDDELKGDDECIILFSE